MGRGVHMNFFGHLSTINHHKWLVMQHCFKVGLYRQGFLHDLSKYSPVEFFAGVKYFRGFEMMEETWEDSRMIITIHSSRSIIKEDTAFLVEE